MDPLSNETNGMELPPAPAEQASAGAPAETNQQIPEMGRPATPEKSINRASTGVASMPMPIIPQVQTPMPVAAQGQPRQAPAVPPTASLQASDDSDLIEKEWVNKAKQIVERTRNDPHKQTEELTLVKVDYMKKRYNKTIKLSK
jgi:hypothetical protein